MPSSTDKPAASKKFLSRLANIRKDNADHEISPLPREQYQPTAKQ